MKTPALIIILILFPLSQSKAQSESKDISTALYEMQKARYEHLLGKPYLRFDVKISNSLYLSNSDLANKVVFINFWAEHCGPCIAETEGLIQLYSKLEGNNDFLFVSFSYDNESTIRRLINKHGINFRVYHLDKNDFSQLNYGQGIPTSIILDRDGIIKYFSTGGPGKKDQATQYVMNIIYQEILQQIENK